jgi:hypothetical protein
MKCLAVSLIVVVGIVGAACSQSDPPLPTGGSVHPGTAILDSMIIFAGERKQVDEPVHPGTTILDSEGIFAGTPILVSKINGNAATTSAATVK